jgi:molybdopterin/thiamine biosynthesis adenylyltransferase
LRRNFKERILAMPATHPSLDVATALAHRVLKTDWAWQPRVFDLSRSEDCNGVESLLKSSSVEVHDTLEFQLAELLAARGPERDAGDPARARIATLLQGTPLPLWGRWVHYSWSGRLVHLLPPEEFHELRTDRNRYKILPSEQAALRQRRIGIVGLSSGLAAALTLALEGVGGVFRLADFDTLSISNLNRIRASVHELGTHKAVIAARQMFELDPYLDISVFDDGITEDNCERFLLEGGKLDLLIEECDDLFAKVRLRERARAHGIPVLMETSDRGLLDVERFDRTPERPVLHGLLGGVDAAALRGLSAKQKIPYILRILDPARLSVTAAASLIEVKQTISTWPQLASAVSLGGAVITDATRRILLGQFDESGRFYIDLEDLVANGKACELRPSFPPGTEIAAEALQLPPEIPKPAPGQGPVTDEELKYIVGHGIVAPSGGNNQPWKFDFAGGRLHVKMRPDRERSFLDFQDGATCVAIGAAVENMAMAAAELGLRASLELPGEGADTLAILDFLRDSAVPADALFPHIRFRATNRKLGVWRLLEPADEAALIQAANQQGVRLDLLKTEEELARLGSLLGRGDRFGFLTEAIHRSLTAEFKWTPEEVLKTRDGFDVATLELSAADLAALRVCSSWPAMAQLRRFHGGKVFEERARDSMRGAAAAGLLMVDGVGRDAYVRGGRALQRVWLTATARKLAFQPHSAMPYLFARLERGRGVGLTPEDIQILGQLRQEYRQLFDVPKGSAEVLLFRVFHAEAPKARSIRRRLQDVLTIHPDPR